MPGGEEALRRTRQWLDRSATDVMGLAKEFVEPYGLDEQPLLESSPFHFHDAGHRFSNLPATVYGELQQSVFDHAAFDRLYGSGAVHGNPGYHGQVFSNEPVSDRRTRFVNYTSMPSKQEWTAHRDRQIQEGLSPGWFSPGSEYGWDETVAKRINEEQRQLSGLIKLGDRNLKEGNLTAFEGSGSYQPDKGFMPTPEMRNTREVAPDDINTARARGQAYGDALLQGYRSAVEEGRYSPQRPVVDGMVDAADLDRAAKDGAIRVGRGWADEGIFPYRDRIGALSNPPARIDPSMTTPSAMGHILSLAEDAREGRQLDRVRGAVRAGTTFAGSLAAAVPFTSEEVWRRVGRRDYGGALQQAATEVGVGALASPAVGMAAGALQRVAPAAAPAVFGTLAPAALAGLPTDAVKAYSAFLGERTGRGLAPRLQDAQDAMAGMTRSMRAESPRPRPAAQQSGPIRTEGAQTARQVIPQLLPTPRAVPANTPSGVARVTRTRPQNPLQRIEQEARRRMGAAVRAFNPGRGDFGITELLGR